MLTVRFADTRPSDVEQELTQKDQFDTDRVPLPATLVREAIQNTNDARAKGSDAPVVMRIGFHKASAPAFPATVFQTLRRHLEAVGVPTDALDFEHPDFLTLEDFGTTGLTGSVTAKDNEHFSDFWRRIGKSHKRGSAGGSWGLGKLVFPFSSRIYTVFGLTVRDGDSAAGWLMGQSILSTHSLDGVERVPHGFTAEFAANGLPVPTSDPVILDAFRKAAGLTRINEPGLSLAIPFPRDELTPEGLIPLVIEHYFFPILTGRLVVHIGTTEISAGTINALIGTHKAGNLRSSHIAFIRELHEAREAGSPVMADACWVSRGFAAAFPETALEALRTRYARGELVHVRVPLTVKPLGETDVVGEFDLFLKVVGADQDPVTLFVRNAITIPNEARGFSSPAASGALVATDGPVAAFLRDAENPAHTLWNGRAEKLTRNWRTPGPTLAAVRRALRELNALLENSPGISDPDALLDILNIRRAADTPKPSRNPIVRKPVVDAPPPRPPRYRLNTQRGGFALVGGPGLGPDDLPLKLVVRCGYAVARGNALKRWDRNDFEFDDGGALQVELAGAVSSGKGNRLGLAVTDKDFRISVSGFDLNRDLVVSVSEVRE